MHDTITVGVPVLAILFGILLNQRGLERLDTRIDKLEAKIEARFTHMESRIHRIQADLAQFYRSLGEHSARIEALEKR
jgi:hypothetical protein